MLIFLNTNIFLNYPILLLQRGIRKKIEKCGKHFVWYERLSMFVISTKIWYNKRLFFSYIWWNIVYRQLLL